MPARNKLTRKERTARRDAALKKRIVYLYEKKRIRLDDCIEQAADEFFLSPVQVQKIWNGYVQRAVEVGQNS